MVLLILFKYLQNLVDKNHKNLISSKKSENFLALIDILWHNNE